MSTAVRDIVRVARALSEPARVRLLRELAARGSMMCVEVQQFLRLAQPTVSHHVKTLVEAGLVETEKQGRHVRIWLSLQALEQFCQRLRQVVQSPSCGGSNAMKGAP